MTTTITIQNVGTFTIPTSRVHEIISWINSAQVVIPIRQTTEMIAGQIESDGKTLING
jgi:hypothetical protein